MRADATVRAIPVRCPNASLLGFSRTRVNPGDLILYRERYEGGTEGRRLARVFGAVWAPALGETPPTRGDLCVYAMSDDGGYGYERWVNPADVLETIPAERLETVRAFMSRFLAADWPGGAAHRREFIRQEWGG